MSKNQLPDPSVVEAILAAMERHPFAILSILVLAGLSLGIVLVNRR